MRFEDLPFHQNAAVTEDVLPALLIQLLQEVGLVRGDLHSGEEKTWGYQTKVTWLFPAASTEITIRNLPLVSTETTFFLEDRVSKMQKIT